MVCYYPLESIIARRRDGRKGGKVLELRLLQEVAAVQSGEGGSSLDEGTKRTLSKSYVQQWASIGYNDNDDNYANRFQA